MSRHNTDNFSAFITIITTALAMMGFTILYFVKQQRDEARKQLAIAQDQLKVSHAQEADIVQRNVQIAALKEKIQRIKDDEKTLIQRYKSEAIQQARADQKSLFVDLEEKERTKKNLLGEIRRLTATRKMIESSLLSNIANVVDEKQFPRFQVIQDLLHSIYSIVCTLSSQPSTVVYDRRSYLEDNRVYTDNRTYTDNRHYDNKQEFYSDSHDAYLTDNSRGPVSYTAYIAPISTRNSLRLSSANLSPTHAPALAASAAPDDDEEDDSNLDFIN